MATFLGEMIQQGKIDERMTVSERVKFGTYSPNILRSCWTHDVFNLKVGMYPPKLLENTETWCFSGENWDVSTKHTERGLITKLYIEGFSAQLGFVVVGSTFKNQMDPSPCRWPGLAVLSSNMAGKYVLSMNWGSLRCIFHCHVWFSH